MGITLQALAEKLGLSKAAVSMALNGRSGVSEATRMRVVEAAKAEGFDFSRLRGKEPIAVRPGTVYMVVYRRHGAVVADTPFFEELFEGVNLGAQKYGLYLHMLYLYEDSDIPARLHDMETSGCIGMILLGTEMRWDDFLPFADTALPLVVLDTYFEKGNRDCVLINNVQGAYIAACHLISQCKAQPGYLRSGYAINNFSERADGFYKAIRENGMSTSKSAVHFLSPSVEGAYSDMLALLQQGEQPARCYFADNDLIAVGAMKALAERGYRIPQDVAIVGFDDLPVTSYCDPPLTTIHVAKRRLGELAVMRLTQLLREPDAIPVKTELSTKLIKRKSV